MPKAFIITDDMVETVRFTLSGICGFQITAQTARKALESAQKVAPAAPPAQNSRVWQDMTSGPKDGKHVILAVRTECGCFVYSVQGAFMQGEWSNAANIKTEPLAWMPNVMLPDEFCPWTDAFKVRAALKSEGSTE